MAAATRASGGRGADGKSRGWMAGLACGVLIMLAAPTAALAGVLLLPAILVFALDRLPGRPVGTIVLIAGGAMALSPLLRLWGGGGDWAVARDLLANVSTIAAAWAVQGAALLAAELAPVIARLAMELRVAAQAAALRSARTRLESEWGLPPADPVP
jgi:hypothetical protein